MTSEAIVVYLPCDFDFGATFNGDEMCVELRLGLVCRPEFIKATLDACHDFLNPLIEALQRDSHVLTASRRI